MTPGSDGKVAPLDETVRELMKTIIVMRYTTRKAQWDVGNAVFQRMIKRRGKVAVQGMIPDIKDEHDVYGGKVDVALDAWVKTLERTKALPLGAMVISDNLCVGYALK